MKIGRNEKCPCGSEKKYKNCCLRKDEVIAENIKENKEIYVLNMFSNATWIG